jgi:hypothetical protein
MLIGVRFVSQYGMAVPTKLCCYDTSLLTVKPVINFIRKILE